MTRKPTQSEAVAIILAQLTQQSRQACIAHWRERYGDAFADQVEAEARAKFKERAK